jgi:hypothetical protein
MMHSTNRAIAAAALLSVLAALPAAAALLPAGKPAGVKEANMAGPGLLWIGVAGILAVTIAVVASNGGNDGVTTPTTTATGTVP